MTVNNKMTSDALEQEMLRFQGVWKQTGYEVDGIADAQDDFGAEALTTISGNQFVVNDADGRVLIEGRFTIDPGQIPKAIDWTDTFGEDAGSRQLASIRFAQHSLTLLHWRHAPLAR